MAAGENDAELVFVYGTLRRGGSNAFRMEGAEFVSAGEVEGRLYAISWYPGFVPGAGLGQVKGDVFRVAPEQMRALDEFEGLSAGEIEGSEYRRVKVPVLLDGVAWEESHRAWVYEWIGPVEEGRRIVSGDWLEVEEARETEVAVDDEEGRDARDVRPTTQG